jgi:mRNA interferase RelE/StbE
MTYKVLYAKNAVKQLKKLPKFVAKSVVDKVKFYSLQKNPLKFAKKLNHPAFGEYRYRVGDYRVVFDVDSKGKVTVLLILTVKHMKDSYKDL